MYAKAPIGIFDSGYGGLTVFRSIWERLPQYDYLYLGDNARAPYGSRSFSTVYEYTLECVTWMFSQGCPLVILACNTASARALRTIQQHDLPGMAPDRRVLGIIRPTAEVIGLYTESGVVGVLGTKGTIQSGSYETEISHQFPQVQVYGEACPLWVPLVEAGEHEDPGADYFVKKHLQTLLAQDSRMDAVLLACTHYPLLEQKIRQHLPQGVALISQGPIVAESLADYLLRHPEMDERISAGASTRFFTTDAPESFDGPASRFFGQPVKSELLDLTP
jgi:glutamate racemase